MTRFWRRVPKTKHHSQPQKNTTPKTTQETRKPPPACGFLEAKRLREAQRPGVSLVDARSGFGTRPVSPLGRGNRVASRAREIASESFGGGRDLDTSRRCWVFGVLEPQDGVFSGFFFGVGQRFWGCWDPEISVFAPVSFFGFARGRLPKNQLSSRLSS